VSLVANLGLLGFFKYFNFFAGSLAGLLAQISGQPADFQALQIVLPVGISFYTFQSMSYTIDIYQRRLQPADSLRQFALFVAFFPQLVAGPIVRARSFLPQLKNRPRLSDRRMGSGLFLILTGLTKKVIFADTLGRAIVDPVFRTPHQFGSLESLMAAYGYSFQIYFDFSGYSDVAIGSAALFGLRLPVNFRHPFLAQNPSDLWRRWHISLSTWLRDYLYIPLGGNRLGKFRTQFNLAATMVLGGLWHGAAWTFVFWGALHGGYLMLHRWLCALFPAGRGPRALPRWLKIVVMFHLTCFAFVFFRASSLTHGWQIIEGVFAGIGRRPLPHRDFYIVAFLVVAAGHLTSWAWLERLQRGFQSLPPALQSVVIIALTGILGACSYQHRPFIYFQF
jgi:D-alanyl-lipoteichoic acid acyltransferase DltB (MBOAT superfamily)